MSKFNPLYTIIVTVIGGRYFAHNPDAKLYVECRFTDDVLSTISPDSNSILSTDKVEQVSFPIWDTELAWEVDQKTLHTLRSQWAHLKLQCFSVNSNGGSELVGYYMLDLRGAAERPGKEKWITLKSRVQGLHPEIEIGFCILPNLSQPSGYIPSPLGRSTDNVYTYGIRDDRKKSTATSEEQFNDLYRIGSKGTEIFLFEITINFGNNLQLLLQDTASFITQQQFPELDLSTLNHGYFFQYTLFESNITSSKFYDLVHPDIRPETATFRIQSSLEDMLAFLSKESKLVIHLYHDNQIIGFADIPLTGLFDAKSGEPRSLDRVCPMYNAKRELPVSADVQTARIGVFMAIRREPTNSLSVDTSESASSSAAEREKSFLLESVGQNSNNERKYRVLIDLESIKLNKEMKSIYIRYSYPALGITSNKSTHMLPNVEADSDVILTNGTSTIDVNMTPQRIQRYFENVPLLMEIWQNNEQKNFQVGVATLRLEEVFLSQNTVDEVTKADIKTFTTLAPIKSVGLATSREMGHVSVSVRLEDYGEIESEGRSKHRSTLTKSHSTADLLDVSNDLHSSADESTTVESDRSSQHTKVSNKKKVEGDDCEQPLSKFRTDLFQQVGENMKLMRDVLASSKKNTKGQSFSKSKVQQMRTIDRQLQQSILYFQTRDESLLRAEKDFQRRWLELDRQHEKRRRETISRLEAEYAQKEKNLMQNNPINDTIKGLQAEVNSLKAQLDSTTRAQRHYESQWLRALQVLANTHDTESEEATIWKGLREMDQCWWQVRRMAEEEMEVLSYERLELDILKDEIEKLKAQTIK